MSSKKVKVDGTSLQGYTREDLWESWERYCPTPLPDDGEPAEPPEPPRSEHPGQVPDSARVPEPAPQTEPDAPPLTSPVPPVPEVPALSAEDPDPAYVDIITGGAQ